MTTATVKLNKVAADYKLQPNESFLLQGRINKAFPLRPYYHVTMRGDVSNILDATSLNSAPVPLASALTKLFNNAVLELLKDKAAILDAGSSIETNITEADVVTFITELGNRERTAISGEELIDFATSYAMKALAQVHGWTQAQQDRVAMSLRAYAAPAHKKPVSDAEILLARLEPLPSLLTGEDAAVDDTIASIYKWLTAKLTRDAAATTANLADSI